MTTTFVTRHAGALDWAREEDLLPEGCVVASSFDPERVQPGDLVIGTLPAQVAARICERGGRYQHLTIDLPEQLRGSELTAEQLRACRARLEEFDILRSTLRPRSSAQPPRNVHVVLASGENLPNVIPALASPMKAQQVVILASRTMAQTAVMLRHGLLRSGLDKRSVRIHPEGCPDHDLKTILHWARERAAELHAEYRTDRLILNLTGGNKLMTVAFQQAFRACAEIVYCDTERDRIDYFHPLAQTPEKLPVDLLRLESYLAVQGYSLRQEEPDATGIEQRAELTRQLVCHAPEAQTLLGHLNFAVKRYIERRPLDARVQPQPAGPGKEIVDRMVELKLLDAAENGLRVASERASRYLGGGWLEEWCWLVGKELEQGDKGRRLHRNRWGINLKIDPWDGARVGAGDAYPLNELDAAFVHRNRMLLIECKSGQQISDPGKGQDILNKLEALGKHVGGRLDTKWLLSARRIGSEKQAWQRAQKYGIRIVPPENLRELKNAVLTWMTT